MDTQTQKISILIIGATGTLGSVINKHCLTKPNLLVNIFVRDPQKNPELTTQVEKAGGKVFKGDVTQPDTFKGITKGMHTLIFTLPAMVENVVVDGQIAFIRDAVENGVERIVPSQFSQNFANFSTEELSKVSAIGYKIKVRTYLKTLPVKALLINTGIILDSFFERFQAKGFLYWSDINHQYQLTSLEDTGSVVAAAVARKDQEGDIVYVSNELTIVEMAQAYNKLRGTNFEPKSNGSIEDLKKRAEDFEKQGNPAAFLMNFLVLLYDDRTRFEKTDNKEFSEVQKTSLEEFLRGRPDLKIVS